MIPDGSERRSATHRDSCGDFISRLRDRKAEMGYSLHTGADARDEAPNVLRAPGKPPSDEPPETSITCRGSPGTAVYSQMLKNTTRKTKPSRYRSATNELSRPSAQTRTCSGLRHTQAGLITAGSPPARWD